MAVTIAVIDGMGGGIGAQIVGRIRKEVRGVDLVALGTNAVATQRMVDAGADRGASGENAIRVTSPAADFIVGPIGIVIPDAMMGEVTAAMAVAVATAPGKKLLLPLNQSHFVIVGLAPKNVGELIDEAVAALVAAMKKGD
jgi:hypothetical protein